LARLLAGVRRPVFPAKTYRRWRGEIFADRYSVAQRFWSMRSKDGGGLFAGISPGQIDAERVVEAFLPHTLTKQFQDLSIPLCIAVTDYYAWKSICIREGSVAPAVAASFAIPMLFQPVVKDGRVLVDGGVADPLPVGMLPDVDIILAVDVIGGPAGDDGQVPTMREALFGSTQILMQTISQEKLQRFPAAVVIRPNIHGFRVLDFLKNA
jgi:NTE family protein